MERLCYLQAFCSWAGIHRGEAQILCTRERRVDERELHVASALLRGGKNSIHPNPKKADLCQIPFEDAAGLGIGPSLEMLRFLSLGGHSSSPWNFTGDEQVKPAKKNSTVWANAANCTKSCSQYAKDFLLSAKGLQF